MKRKPLLLLLIVIASSPVLQAQISKGDIFIGGAIGFGSVKNESSDAGNDNKQSSVTIAPALGVVTGNNLVWGFDLPVSMYKYKAGPSDIVNRTNLSAGAGVFARKYLEVANRLYLFGQGRLGGNYVNEKNSVQGSRQKTTGYGFELSLYPGISYSLKKNIHLESGFYNLASIGYFHRKTTSNNPSVLSSGETSGFSVNAIANNQSTFTLGVRFFLPGKSK
jgi:hypothetical protein